MSPQPLWVTLDAGEKILFPDPLVFTVANLTQYGGGAQIAPQACPDDGFLDLVVVASQDAPAAFANIARLFDGTIDQIPSVVTRRFRKLVAERKTPAPIQVDGEVVDAPPRVVVEVLPKALNVLVPDPVAP